MVRTASLFSELLLPRVEFQLAVRARGGDRRAKGAVKLHLLPDGDGHLSRFGLVTEGRRHDVHVAPGLSPPARSVVAMDRGYNDDSFFDRWSREGVFFVTRMTSNAAYRVVERRAVPTRWGILANEVLEPAGRQARRLRRIVCVAPLPTSRWSFRRANSTSRRRRSREHTRTAGGSRSSSARSSRTARSSPSSERCPRHSAPRDLDAADRAAAAQVPSVSGGAPLGAVQPRRLPALEPLHLPRPLCVARRPLRPAASRAASAGPAAAAGLEPSWTAAGAELAMTTAARPAECRVSAHPVWETFPDGALIWTALPSELF